MADSNLSDKVSETIIKLVKKIQIIEKTRFNIFSFFMISSIIGLTSIYINYYNVYKIQKLEEKIKDSENILKYNIEINRKEHQIIYNKLIDKLQEEINNSSKLLDIIEIKDMISKSTSVCSFSPLKIIRSPENNDNDIDDDDWIKHNIDNNNNNNSHGELINECYDTISDNNSNKNRSFNWFLK